MKMLAPELSPATVFWSQIETKIANAIKFCDLFVLRTVLCLQSCYFKKLQKITQIILFLQHFLTKLIKSKTENFSRIGPV
jgi:hypothetical protein